MVGSTKLKMEYKNLRKKIIVGSRHSKLALCQTELVIKQLQQYFPDTEFEIKKIKTTGDNNLKDSLAKIGGKGVFIQEIEKELEEQTIDFAVHSLKDVTPKLPESLTLGAIPKRASAFDCLISRHKYTSINELPLQARIGTSSMRRQGQLLHLRPDLNIVSIRGNIDSRLKKIQTEHLEGIIVAEAGLERLQPDLTNYKVLSLKNVILPAVGQGCLAVECRQTDQEVLHMLKLINDFPTSKCIHIERQFMRELGGSCNFPIGGYAYMKNQSIKFSGLISSIDGQHLIKVVDVPADEPRIGKKVAQKLLVQDEYGIVNKKN